MQTLILIFQPKGKKKVFYLTTDLTHCVHGYMASDITISDRQNHLTRLHGLFFPVSSKGYFICTIPERERGNVLFNDALNTFYLLLYGVRHMVKDHSDSEKGNPLPPHRLLLSINIKGSFICTIPP